MSQPVPAVPEEHDWRVVDEGWGRKAVEFAALTEPSNCREYVAMHQRLGVSSGDRVLDMACGSGLALFGISSVASEAAGSGATASSPTAAARPARRVSSS